MIKLDIAGRAGVPAGAAAVVLNTTVAGPNTAGFARVRPCSTSTSAPPNALNLNFAAGQTIANLVVVALGSDGGVCGEAADSSADFIADVNGYFPA